jgi:hypothetical protein
MNMSDPSMEHVRRIRFCYISPHPEYTFIPSYIFLFLQPAAAQATPPRSPLSSCQLARSLGELFPIIG